MNKEIIVPDIGNFSEVDVIEILVGVGDIVSVDDSIITLESDKASMDIPTPEGGVVKTIKVTVGDRVKQGSPILVLENSDEPSVHVAADAAQLRVSRGAECGHNSSASLEEVLVPNIGDFDTVDVIEVLVTAGDHVTEEDSLITLESDKASIDIPSPKSGKVKTVEVVVGDQVSEGSLILMLEVTDNVTSSLPETDRPSVAETIKPAAEPITEIHDIGQKRVHASPSVRRIAREQGIDLQQLSATGLYDRVTKQDVLDFKNGTGRFNQAGNAAASLNISAITQPDWSKFGEISSVPISRIGKLSATHLHHAWLNIPHVTHFDEADITELEAFRQRVKSQANERGFAFTRLVFMMKAVVDGLKTFPKFNSARNDDGENLTQRHFYHIGIAVDTPDGLVVPVIRDVDHKGLLELAQELDEVSKRARSGQLKITDMQGGCFTISSLGSIGATHFTPIINAPEVGILGLARSQTRLVRQNNEIVDRLIQPLAVSYDHRVIDGAYAARFVSHIAQVLTDIRYLVL